MKTLFTFAVTVFAFAIPCYSQLDFSFADGIVEGEVVEKIWDGSFAAGLNGKTGNSQNIDINMNFNLTRKVDLALTKFQANYFYAANDVSSTTNRYYGLSRHEVRFANHPKYSWFSQGTLEADRFKSYDYLISMHTGLVCNFLESDHGFWKFRFGGGASKQFSGVNDAWVPELQFGTDWERKLSRRTKLYTSADYFPNTNDFSDYRFITNVGVDFIIDNELNLNFRVFILDRFDSTPEPSDVNSDLDYGMAIVYGF